MKTNFIKNGLLLCASILIFSCKKEANNNLEETLRTERIRPIVSEVIEFSQFKESKEFEKIETISNLFTDTNNDEFISINSSNQNNDQLIIHTDKIKKVKVNNHISYTFPLKLKTKYSSTFQNLTIDFKGNEVKAFISTYIPDLEWIKKYKINKSTQFYGKIQIETISLNKLPKDVKISNSDVKTHLGGVCETYSIFDGSVGVPCASGWHLPGDNSCSYLGTSNEAYYQDVYRNVTVCGPEGRQDLNNGGGGAGGAGEVAEWTAGTTYPPAYTPCEEGGGPRGGSPCDESPESSYSPIVYNLFNALTLNYDQADYLSLAENFDEAFAIDQLLKANDYSNEALMASKVTLAVLMNGVLNGPYDANFFNIISTEMTNVTIDPVWIAHFNMRVAIVRLQHPKWNSVQVYWEASREMIHLGLDIIGLVPVVGEVFDLTSGILYTIEGDGVNATLSYASAIPGFGWYAAGVKMAKRTIQLANGSQTTIFLVKQTDNLLNFGNRAQIRKILNLAKGDPRQAHHLIPWEARTNPIVQKAAQDGFHMNDALNGIPLPRNIHIEGMVHSSYNAKINIELQEILSTVGSNVSPSVARQELQDLISKIRLWINNNPGVNINNITF